MDSFRALNIIKERDEDNSELKPIDDMDNDLDLSGSV